ncbi:MAG TPA: hypothetical protein PK048_02535 [Candidatus Absconditabacterales bacterium]|nr:hypothetical protein [Candidatus Absconditabacterales bacterium]
MSFHQFVLLIIMVFGLGLLGWGIKQGTTNPPIVASNTHSNNAIIKVMPTAPAQAPSSDYKGGDSGTHNAYQPGQQQVSISSEPTLLDKAHAFAYQAHITSFTNLKEFKPQEPLSREAAAKMMVWFARYIDQEGYFLRIMTGNNCVFKDKSDIGKEFFREVVEACYMGIMGGENGYFMPRMHLSHDQANKLISRITGLPATTGSQLAITRGGLIESMLDQYVLLKK